jgi:plastocyanin
MFKSGLSLSGVNTDPLASKTESATEAKIENEVQIVNTSLYSSRYEPITVQAGLPVKWTITAESGSINGCNIRIIIPEYGIEKKLEEGDNIIEFTPTKAGTYSYSCWMGMIRSSITVTDGDGSSTSSDSSETEGLIGDEIEIPASYTIPTDKIQIAEIKDDVQYVEINMEEAEFSPAIIILKRGIGTEWIINAKTIDELNSYLLFPYYNAQLTISEGENLVNLVPEEDFVFSDANNSFYGYVKVVDDLNDLDIEAIKEEVSNYKTTIWNYSGASCH